MPYLSSATPVELDLHAAPRADAPPAVVKVIGQLSLRLDQEHSELAQQFLAAAARSPSLTLEIHLDSVQLAEQPQQPRLRVLPTPATEPRLRIVVASRLVYRDGKPVDLTRLEFDLLLFLCEHPGRVFDRRSLLRAVWGIDHTITSRTVDVHMRRLRTKLGRDLELITTVRGVGYRLDAHEEVAIDRPNVH